MPPREKQAFLKRSLHNAALREQSLSNHGGVMDWIIGNSMGPLIDDEPRAVLARPSLAVVHAEGQIPNFPRR